MVIAFASCFIGMAQGMRHACEPDHIAAVSTLVAEQRSPRSSMFYATAWGAGHGLILSVVGGALVALRTRMPSALEDIFELFVGVMLVGLGVRALRHARSGQPGQPGARATHHTPHTPHAPHAPHAPQTLPTHRWHLARRPLCIGILHGLAGSGSLTALVLAGRNSLAAALVFMALYAGGAMLGMVVLAGTFGHPLARLAQTSKGLPALLASSGTLSLGLGAFWTYSAFLRVFGA